MMLFISCTSNQNKLYQAGKIWYYDAEYHNSDSLFNYRIELIPGGVFLLQQKIKWIVILPNNNVENEVLFRSEATTGFKENDSEIWLHPPRSHQFKYLTQLAPYPQVKLPLILGDTIKGSINMVSNWGEWNGKSSRYQLVLTDKKYSSVYQDTLWLLKGKGILEQDTASVTHWFSKTEGFVSSIYANNKGEYFEMKLKK